MQMSHFGGTCIFSCSHHQLFIHLPLRLHNQEIQVMLKAAVTSQWDQSVGLVEKWDTTKIQKCALITSPQRLFKDERYCNTKKAKSCHLVKLVP